VLPYCAVMKSLAIRCLAVASLVACTGKGDDETPWLLTPQDLGDDRASGTGFDLGDADATWVAADQLIPGMYWSWPALEMAETVFNTLLDDEGVTDPGTCPYTVADGATLTYVSNCRSQDGYQFDGTVSYTDGDTDGRDWRRWELDLEVAPSDDFPDFQRVLLRGTIITTQGNGDDDLIDALQANVHLGVEEYFEAINGDETEEAIWADWKLSARFERHDSADGTRILMEGATDLGSLGGFTFSGTDLVLPDTCPNEADGTLTVGAGTLTFDGSDGCDRCATLAVDGAEVDACP